MNLIFVSLVTLPSYRIWYDTTLQVEEKKKHLNGKHGYKTPQRMKKWVLPCGQVHLFGHSVRHADRCDSPRLGDADRPTAAGGGNGRKMTTA